MTEREREKKHRSHIIRISVLHRRLQARNHRQLMSEQKAATRVKQVASNLFTSVPVAASFASQIE